MATSSFSKEFVVKDQNSVKDLLHAIENPTAIKLQQSFQVKESQDKQDLLCAIKKRLVSAN